MQVFMIVAMTADGYVDSKGNSRSFDWTSQADKNFYINAIKRAGVVVCGSTTFKPMRKFPKGLEYYVYTSKPDEFVNHRPDVIKAYPTQKDPADLLRDIEKKGYQEVSISGGASIYTMFLKAGLIDKIFISVEPIFFGKGVNLLNDDLNVRLKLIDVKKISEEGTVVLEYDVLR